MKKIYSGLVALLLVLGVTSCGNNKGGNDPKPSTSEQPSVTENVTTPAETTPAETTTTPAETTPAETTTTPAETIDPATDDTIRADNSVDGYAVLCDGVNSINGTPMQAWGGFDGSTVGGLEATSFKAIYDLDAELATKLATDYDVKAIYKVDKLEIAKDKIAGWDYEWGNPKQKINGSYAIKFGVTAYDEENEKYAVGNWIPSPEVKPVEVLTPDTYWVTPNWVEEKDENGYDHNSNPAVIGGAGEYTAVLVKFGTAVNGGIYGIGMIKTQSWDEFVPAELDHWKLTGNFGGEDEWKEGSTTATYQFTKEGKLTVALEAEKQFKATKVLTDGTGTWEGAIGPSDTVVPEDLATAFDLTGDNIVCKTAGTYDLTITEVEGVYKLNIAAHVEA